MDLLNTYEYSEGIEFDGLMESVVKKQGINVIGNEMAVLDINAIIEQIPSDGKKPDGRGKETQASFDYIWNEETWNLAYSHEALQNYYEDYPEEDCWNVEEQRAVNYNDRYYTGILNSEKVSAKVTWASDNSQKLTIDDVDYYAPIFYGFTPQAVELFNDIALTDSTGDIFDIEKIEYSDKCPHCWDGAISNPGATYPWCVVSLPNPFNGTIRFIYNETNVVERSVNASHGYYIETIPSLFGSEYKLDENGQTTFDETLLNIVLITQ